MKAANQHHEHHQHHRLTRLERLAWFLVGLILFTAIVGAFTACNGVKRTQRHLVRAHVLHPDLTAGACADWYPIQTHDSVRVEYKQGETVMRYDTVRVDCDEVTPDSTGRRIVYTPCPPCPTRTDTLLRTWTQVRENTARVRELEGQRDKAKSAYIEMRGNRNWWRIIALILIGYTVVRIALRVWLKISLP
jgi:hypothetical protein